jgi:hypothetical protein
VTEPLDGYVEIAGLNVPLDVAPTLMAAIRTIYASQVEGLDDATAVAVVTKAVMVDVLDRYALWLGAADLQATLAPLQQAVTDAQTEGQSQIAAARAAAAASAACILAPGQQPPA